MRLANEAARQTRLTARSLEGADGVGDLKTALESLAMNISQNCRVKSTVKANGASLPISAPVSAQLYRIAQEAVRNAVEHGAAREVLIQLTFGHRGHAADRTRRRRGFQQPRRTATAWGFESCAIERSASAARAKCTPAPVKGPSFIAVCRWKRSLPFLRSHECNNTNRKKIVAWS